MSELNVCQRCTYVSVKFLSKLDVCQSKMYRMSELCMPDSVAATKLSSKFHAKVSRKFWEESLKLFDETFARKFRREKKFRREISHETCEIVSKFLRKHYMRFVSH